MKKSLIISDVFPLPEISGNNIRTMNFSRFFNKLGSLDIAYTYPSPGKAVEDSYFSKKYQILKEDYPTGIIGRAAAFFRGQPYPVREYGNSFKNALSALIKRENFDYILIRYFVNTYRLFTLPLFIKKKIIVDFDDVISDRLYDSLFDETQNIFRRFQRSINRRLLKGYEKKCLEFGASIFCSENDKMQTSKGRKNAFVVPNIYANRSFTNYDFGNGSEKGKTLLFVGTLFYRPNVDGLRWFIESIYPEFLKKFPDGRMLIVGSNPCEDVIRLCKTSPHIELYINVPDVKEYYKQCTAVVVPILTGGGTRIKILEAAMARRPVFSTAVGAEGIEMVDGRDFHLFSNADEFCLKFSQTLESQSYSAMTESALELVGKKYSNVEFEAAMWRVVHSIDEARDNFNSGS